MCTAGNTVGEKILKRTKQAIVKLGQDQLSYMKKTTKCRTIAVANNNYNTLIIHRHGESVNHRKKADLDCIHWVYSDSFVPN